MQITHPPPASPRISTESRTHGQTERASRGPIAAAGPGRTDPAASRRIHGCTRCERAPAAQAGFGQFGQVTCGTKRGTPDVALVADPATGVAVYDSLTCSGQSGWWQVGGTSASSPMWAARSAAAGVMVNAAYVYGTAIAYRDITNGSNGAASCLPGYDLVTGRGSWTGATP